MGGSKRADEEPEEPSRAVGGCVLVLLGGVVVAAAFAADEGAGVLLVVAAGTAALYRSARRKGTYLALPSPPAHPTHNSVPADQMDAAARAAYDPNGVMRIVRPLAEGEVNEP